ncbi:MAG TPA: NAD(P)-binding domain-containing protein [Longimicrobiales bacterium]|nr:NAD(P)-binding domain-containing protein [Longimicrobiales bacterium]
MKVGVIGSGAVGKALASGFLKHGHTVMCASRDPSKLEGWKAEAGPRASVGTPAEAARWGELLVLAVKGSGAEEAVRTCGIENLAGKTVIDTTNPIADAPPEDGVIRFFTGLDGSLMERLQRLAPEARFVKSFSCVGNALMVDPVLEGGPPTMFMCGNDEGAKREVQQMLEDFGWEWEDLGAATAARAIEPLCILWCIPGFLRDDWAHTYKVLRRRGPAAGP